MRGTTPNFSTNHFLGILGADFQIEDVDPGKLLEENSLPSMTGLAAIGPIFPRPNTAVPFETTVTKLPRAVYLKTSSGRS